VISSEQQRTAANSASTHLLVIHNHLTPTDELVASSRSTTHPVPLLAAFTSVNNRVDQAQHLLITHLHLLQERVEALMVNLTQGSKFLLVRHDVRLSAAAQQQIWRALLISSSRGSHIYQREALGQDMNEFQEFRKQ
jgi:hypothetical protein